MDGGEGDVLVAPAVAADEVDVEQLVVVLAAERPVSRLPPATVSASAAFGEPIAPGPALWAMSLRNAVPMRMLRSC